MITTGKPMAKGAAKRRAAAFAITVSFELVEGGFVEFHRLVSENAALSVELEPDCLRFDVLTPAEASASCHVLLYEIYSDRVAFDLHLASDHFLQFDRLSRNLVTSKHVLAYAVQENAKLPERT